MRLYDFKRGHKKSADEIEAIMQEMFDNVRREGEHILAEYKGLKKIEVWLEGKKLAAETESRDVPNEDAMDTLKKWNDFLFRVTGYTSKERKKKLSK